MKAGGGQVTVLLMKQEELLKIVQGPQESLMDLCQRFEALTGAIEMLSGGVKMGANSMMATSFFQKPRREPLRSSSPEIPGVKGREAGDVRGAARHVPVT